MTTTIESESKTLNQTDCVDCVIVYIIKSVKDKIPNDETKGVFRDEVKSGNFKIF